MNLRKLVPILGILAIAVASMGAKGCPTFPKLEDRIVELAVGGSVTLPWQARGIINTYNDTDTFDMGTALNLGQILDDAGIDASDVKSISVSGVFYRITAADPNPGRTITNGTVQIQRGGGAVTSLVTNFTADASTTTGWIGNTLSPAGVTLLNGVLTDALASAQNGTPIPNGNFTFTVNGVSNPTGAETNFDWELRLDISIVGEFEMQVLN
jgi:hypothetical protein